MMFVNRERAKIQREKGGEAKSGPALKFITEPTGREPFL